MRVLKWAAAGALALGAAMTGAAMTGAAAQSTEDGADSPDAQVDVQPMEQFEVNPIGGDDARISGVAELTFLPDAHTDFVFSAFSEDLAADDGRALWTRLSGAEPRAENAPAGDE